MPHAKLSLARRGPSTHETPRVHHGTCSCSDVANRGVGAAVGTNASDRGVFCGGRRRERRGHTVPPGGVPAWFAAIGWSDGRNIQIDYRWGGGNAASFADTPRSWSRCRRMSSSAVAPPQSALLQVTRTVPIVFAGVVDPVGAGFVDNLARPGGNATASSCSNIAWAENCWSCSNRSRQA